MKFCVWDAGRRWIESSSISTRPFSTRTLIFFRSPVTTLDPDPRNLFHSLRTLPPPALPIYSRSDRPCPASSSFPLLILLPTRLPPPPSLLLLPRPSPFRLWRIPSSEIARLISMTWRVLSFSSLLVQDLR